MSEIVVLTRRPEDNAPLADALRSRGATVLELPCVRTERLGDTTALERELASLRGDDLLVLTSRAGADAVAGVVRHIPCEVAAVGPATAESARRAGMRVTYTASRADAETLGRELPLPRGDVLLARSDLADGGLPAVLRERGARVREVVAYRTVGEVTGDPAPVRAAFAAGAAIVVASPSAVAALRNAFGGEILRAASFVAIGPRTARSVRELIGVEPTVARGTDIDALADAIAHRPQEVTT